MTTQTAKRVLMLGLDSADIEYLRSYLPTLPHLRQLFADGRLFDLATTARTIDGSVWPTFAQATLPGEHGVYFPFQFDPERMEYRRLDADWLAYEPFWNALGAQGLPVVVLDVPIMPLPPTPSAGVSYFRWHSQDEGRPLRFNRSAIAKDIESRFGRSPLGFDLSADKTASQLHTLRRACISSARKRAELVGWLLARDDWRLAVITFSELHRAGHYLCPDPDDAASADQQHADLLSVYQAIDEALGSILQGIDLGNTGIVVFSLHGMGPNNSQAHFVPQILERLNASMRGDASHPLRPGIKRPYMRMLRERLPGGLQHAVAAAVPQPIRDWVVNRAFTSGIDWSRTLGFTVLSGGQGLVRCNVRGREASGVLERGGFEHLDYLRRLEQTFLGLRTAEEDEPLVESVNSLSEQMPGARSDYLPDVSFAWRNRPPAREVYSPTLGTFRGKIRTGRGGNHRPSAFALVVDKAGRAADGDEPTHIMGLASYVERMLRTRSG